MDRPLRKRIVIVSAACLISLFMGVIGVPLLSVPFSPDFDFSGDGGENFFKSADAMFQYVHMVNYICLACLLIAGGCLIYLLITLAVWFIGPKEEVAQVTE